VPRLSVREAEWASHPGWEDQVREDRFRLRVFGGTGSDSRDQSGDRAAEGRRSRSELQAVAAQGRECRPEAPVVALLRRGLEVG
jgi:hypothetical protein